MTQTRHPWDWQTAAPLKPPKPAQFEAIPWQSHGVFGFVFGGLTQGQRSGRGKAILRLPNPMLRLHRSGSYRKSNVGCGRVVPFGTSVRRAAVLDQVWSLSAVSFCE